MSDRLNHATRKPNTRISTPPFSDYTLINYNCNYLAMRRWQSQNTRNTLASDFLKLKAMTTKVEDLANDLCSLAPLLSVNFAFLLEY